MQCETTKMNLIYVTEVNYSLISFTPHLALVYFTLGLFSALVSQFIYVI